MENRLYDFASFVDRLASDVRPKAVERLLAEYIKAGAHPYFLAQVMRLADQQSKLIELADRILVDLYATRESVPEAWDREPYAAASRLYEPKCDNPRLIYDQGIIYGAIVEFFRVSHRMYAGTQRKIPPELCARTAEKLLGHPLADIGVLDSLNHAIYSLREATEGEATFVFQGDEEYPSSHKEDRIFELTDEFIAKRIRASSVVDVIREILGVWEDKSATRGYSIFRCVERVVQELPLELPATHMLEALLSVPLQGAGRLAHAAQQILRAYPVGIGEGDMPDAYMAISAIGFFISDLKQELPSLRTRHAVIRWLKRLEKKPLEQIVAHLAFTEQCQIDTRIETLVEEVFGPKAWEAICAYQDPSLWKVAKELVKGFHLRSGALTDKPQYKELVAGLHSSNLQHHESVIAEEFERIVHKENPSLEEIQKVLEYHLNLLSGELVMAVAHLRDEWMPVKKTPDEFLGAHFPRVEICRHKTYGDNGAACRFKFEVPRSVRMLRGSLNSEGEVELENTPILDDTSKLAVRAMVAQTMCDVLIPHCTDTFPSGGHGGQWIPPYEEPWTRRPVVHTLGKIEEENGHDQGFGTKINPVMVELLFRWLLGERSDYSFRLYVEAEEKIAETTEYFFEALHGAREKLLKKELTLADVHMRIMRAHSRPLPVYLDESNTLRIKKMSARARRNYERYRNGGGRELDFSPVQKTYVVPNNVRVPIMVSRTFIQGSFASLHEAFDFIVDRSLQARVRQAFYV